MFSIRRDHKDGHTKFVIHVDDVEFDSEWLADPDDSKTIELNFINKQTSAFHWLH
jgi:hypothetical protein